MKPAVSDRHQASAEERLAALRIGAMVLKNQWPKLQAYCMVNIGPNQLDAHAAMHWPGVVRVVLRYSGELVAESLPGQPFTLAGRPDPESLIASLINVQEPADVLRLISDEVEKPETADMSGAELGNLLWGWADRLDSGEG